MSIVVQMRDWCANIRRKPSPIADAVPMVQQAADRIEHLERVLLLAKMALEYHTQQTRPIHGTAQTIEAIDEALKS